MITNYSKSALNLEFKNKKIKNLNEFSANKDTDLINLGKDIEIWLN